MKMTLRRWVDFNKRRLYLSIFLISYILIITVQLFSFQKTTDKFSCYNSKDNDFLVSVDKMKTSDGKNIFFIETLCYTSMNSRRACSIEAAARLNPDWNIIILFSVPVSKNALGKTPLKQLLQLENVKAYRLHVKEYTKHAIVEKVMEQWTEQVLNESNKNYPIEPIDDILKILTLNKYGGVYLETDPILTKNIDFFPPNWIIRESIEELVPEAMAFTQKGLGAQITTSILKEIELNYQKSESFNSSLAIQRVLRSHCPKPYYTSNLLINCHGIQLMKPKVFYPFNIRKKTIELKDNKLNGIKIFYMSHSTEEMKKDYESQFLKLAITYCPTIYSLYGQRFGL